MCCSTGVCGPQVDPVLPRFAADLDWLRTQGVSVERFNLAQQPEAFIQNVAVQKLLSSAGTECLPLIFLDDALVSQADYPSRTLLSKWTGLAPVMAQLPMLNGGGCCGTTGCC